MKRIIGILFLIAGIAWAIAVLMMGGDGSASGNSSYDQGYSIGFFIGKLLLPVILILVGALLARRQKD